MRSVEEIMPTLTVALTLEPVLALALIYPLVCRSKLVRESQPALILELPSAPAFTWASALMRSFPFTL